MAIVADGKNGSECYSYGKAHFAKCESGSAMRDYPTLSGRVFSEANSVFEREAKEEEGDPWCYAAASEDGGPTTAQAMQGRSP